ncbi:MAG TPA: class I SAM-dependent methyltransferase [Candidatus Binataceae bacterium]|jgi:SAM-dependent methyltransferase|nr:class I SAM-dependent methyltransferase [Candidatus Binataceae bacterium]
MSGASSNTIGQLFSVGAERYDAVRRNLVPCFDAFYTSALDVIGDWAHGRMPAALEVLDLGAGTGLFSAMVMAWLPRVRLHLIDASDAMLAEARRRFAGVAAPNVSFEVRDYSEGNLGGQWDLVISALSIHHVEDGAKRSLFKRVFEALRPGGLFVNAEQVLGPTPAAEARYRRLWDEQALSSGVDRREYERAVERMLHDRCAPLGVQLEWMRAAGFAEIDCAFKQWRFAVYFGVRP